MNVNPTKGGHAMTAGTVRGAMRDALLSPLANMSFDARSWPHICEEGRCRISPNIHQGGRSFAIA